MAQFFRKRTERTFRVFWVLVLTAIHASAAPVDFSRDVLPILSDACFQCHGPDEKNGQKAGLRLDTKEGAFRTKDGVTPVKPRDLEGSDLIVRILSDDHDEKMPPPKSARQLKAEEKEVLKRWVAEGAEWGRHWAFEPAKKAELPAVVDDNHPVRNEIDCFIGAKLRERQLGTISAEANRERLIRRVTFDLTGLPPTPAEVDSFLGDERPDAYERLVDRLLASSRYGERMAGEWLDVARFADTHGYQMDAPRDMSPWRDWVIKAFNENLPYSDFVTWQLAGDLLPNATREQRLATAFNRLHMQNEEGGVVEEEFRVSYVVDRVNTFGTAFLGLTFECSRCHDHKYDPITQRDFYSLFAFFQNIDEIGQIPWSAAVSDMPVPSMLLATDEQNKKLAELRSRITAKEQEKEAVFSRAHDGFETWLARRTGEFPRPAAIGEFAFDELSEGKSPNSANPSLPAKRHDEPKLVPGKIGQAVSLGGDDGFTFPGIGSFKRTDPFSIALWLRPGPHAFSQVVLHHTRFGRDAASRGYELLLENGRVSFGLHHYAPANSLKVITREPIPVDSWAHIAITYDGSSRAAGLRIFRDGQPVEVEVVRDGLRKDIVYAGTQVQLTLGYRDRDAGFKGGQVDELRIFARRLTPIEVGQIAGFAETSQVWATPADQLSEAQRKALFEFYIATSAVEAREWKQQLLAHREEESRFVQSIPDIMVMEELPKPKKAYILERGAYDARGAEVFADTPKALSPFPDDAPRNRLGLARWLLDAKHPLMARVTVNRLWQMMFGRGIVETSDNFGLQGAAPSHPELLDWLAWEFVESGWNVKALLRKIALSSTYRQASKPSTAAAEFDSENRWLSHAPVRRLTAEMLRDQALATSGLLVEKLGGPSVKPYQPKGLWDIAMGKPVYQQGKGGDLYRRSLYTFVKRTVPPPAMAAFDAADRSYCNVRRQSTSTPLQALALLNDIQMVEAARMIGQRMLTEGGSTLDEQIVWAFKLITCRLPSEREMQILRQLYAEQHALFVADEGAARKILAVGEAKPDPVLPRTDLAASTILANALLNFDEAIVRR